MNNGVAYLTEDRSASYEELNNQAEHIASFAKERSIVVFVASNDYESLTAYYGFLQKKIVPMMVSPTISQEALSDLIDSYSPEYMWCPEGFLHKQGKPVLNFGGYVLLATDCQHDAILHPDLALLLSTSGSTGSKKYVRLSYKNLDANAASICDYLDIKSSDKAITTLPFSYSYGISIINSHLRAKATLVLTDKTVFDREFWDLLKASQATTFGGVPYTYSMLKRLRFGRMDLPSLRYITQAGGRLGEELHQEFLTICADKNIDFFVMYGQTEATARMSYLPPEVSAKKIGSIGIAIPGGKFTLLDDEGASISSPDTPGELMYQGDNVALGYAESRVDLSEGDVWNGVLMTGDIACFDEDGFYRITGRKKRFLKIYGNRVNLDDIESQLLAHGVIAACAGRDDEVHIFVEDGDIEWTREFVAERTSLSKNAFQLQNIEALPRNDAGKIQYAALEELC